MKIAHRDLKNFANKFVLPKVKFASTSLVATLVDYVLYLCLVYSGRDEVPSNLISTSCGFLINFFLQKKFIFSLKRRVGTTFLMSLSFSLMGIVFSTTLIYFLCKWPFFAYYQYITKMMVTLIMFFYNFYTKRWAFERRIGPDAEDHKSRVER